MVPSHRPVGFADGAALFPVYGLDFSKYPLGVDVRRQEGSRGRREAGRQRDVRDESPPRYVYLPGW